MIRKCFFALLFLLIALSDAFSATQKPYRVYLKAGTIITRISDHKDFSLDHGIYAFVLETNPAKRDYFFIFDKAGKPVYQTTAMGVVDISKDMSILPDVDAEISYPAPSVFRANNKHAFLDTQFNLHFDNIDAAPFNTLYGTQLSSAIGTRFEIRTLYSSELPVNFGLSLNMENASWSDENGQMKLSAFSFGPHLQHYVYEQEKVAVSILFGAEYSPSYKTTSGEFTDKYNAVVLDLGTEILWGTEFGKWSAGVHYRRHDLNLTSTTRTDITPVPEDITVNSIGAMLGYKYEWEL